MTNTRPYVKDSLHELKIAFDQSLVCELANDDSGEIMSAGKVDYAGDSRSGDCMRKRAQSNRLSQRLTVLGWCHALVLPFLAV